MLWLGRMRTPAACVMQGGEGIGGRGKDDQQQQQQQLEDGGGSSEVQAILSILPQADDDSMLDEPITR